MSKTRWKAFPHPDKQYEYAGARLRTYWPQLHRGDREPFPVPGELKRLVEQNPDWAPSMALERAAHGLEDAWRAYHRGDFGGAIELGLAIGPLGYSVANKASNIYATYLETRAEAKLALFLESAKRAESIFTRANFAVNAWYLHAQALGRYSQGISVAKALAQGLGGKVKSSLEQALHLDPQHADAHVAMGTFHAEVVNKIGATLGGLSYGASSAEAVKHFETALALNPHSAIARIEYANALAMLFGQAKLPRARSLYAEAAASHPGDAMERLDAELARSELED